MQLLQGPLAAAWHLLLLLPPPLTLLPGCCLEPGLQLPPALPQRLLLLLPLHLKAPLLLPLPYGHPPDAACLQGWAARLMAGAPTLQAWALALAVAWAAA